MSHSEPVRQDWEGVCDAYDENDNGIDEEDDDAHDDDDNEDEPVQQEWEGQSSIELRRTSPQSPVSDAWNNFG